jgi:hypothetical protein
MRIRSILGWTVGLTAALIASSVTGLAFGYPVLHSVPEDPTVVLTILGGAGLAWQYARSRARR